VRAAPDDQPVQVLVADASALVEFILRTPVGDRLNSVVTAPGTDLHVPALCDVEVASALRSALLGNVIPVLRAQQALQDYLDLPLTRHGHPALLTRILELHPTVSAYDATYLALAEALGAPLLTADRRLARAADRLGVPCLPG